MNVDVIDWASDLLLRVDNLVRKDLYRISDEEPCILSSELLVNIVMVFPDEFHNAQ